jgi:hypothetical protein
MLTRQRDLYHGRSTGLSGKLQQIVAEGQAEQLLSVLLSERQVIVDRLTIKTSPRCVAG